MASSAGQRLSREDFKKQKELEELRKSGAAPAEVDEDGKMINPHIPNYISQAPWYLDTSHPSLKHQRSTHAPVTSDIHRYQRRLKKGPTASKYRAGACQNCGSMTHKEKECVERPRKRGAKYTNRDICADEVVENGDLSYDGKRDRWNGYDPSAYKDVISRFDKVDKARARRRAEELDREQAAQASQNNSDSDSDSDSLANGNDDLKDSGAMIQKRDTRTRTTVRNLRIREDTAKYLVNLNSDAHYDPKARSMRQNPFPDRNPEEVSFAGDNFVRFTGDAIKFTDLSLFSWNASDKGADINQAGAPSAAEFAFQEAKKKRDVVRSEKRQKIMEKYGSDAVSDQPDPRLRVSQTESYVEYSGDGKVIKGLEPVARTSKYQEDVFERGHRSIWGSFYRDGRWGYQCCHQLTRNAYCTGDAGKQAARQMQQEMASRCATTARQ